MVMAYCKCSVPEDGAKSLTMIRHLQEWLGKIWLINQSSNYICLSKVYKFTKKSTSHLQILGARRVRKASFILRTKNSAMMCGCHCYLVLCTWRMSTDTLLYVMEKTINIYTGNLCHCRKFSCLQFAHTCAYYSITQVNLRYLVSLVEMSTTNHQ